jgi:hypothetical protein
VGQEYLYDAANPNVDGALLNFTWTQLEPSQGVFAWSTIDSAIAPWASAGKHVGIRVFTAGRAGWKEPFYDGTAAQATPSWVFDDGARSVSESDGSVYPVYWDSAYLSDYKAFVAALAGRYDGNSAVAFVQASTGQGGETVIDSQAVGNATSLVRWQAVGYSSALWQSTVYKTWSYYQASFHRVPLVAVITGGQPSRPNLFAPLADHAIATGLWVQHDGLNPDPYVTYAPVLQAAASHTRCLLEERDQLPITTSGASELAAEIANALAVHAQLVMIYPREVSAATAGSGNYDPAWAVQLQQAHALLNRMGSGQRWSSASGPTT